MLKQYLKYLWHKYPIILAIILGNIALVVIVLNYYFGGSVATFRYIGF